MTCTMFEDYLGALEAKIGSKNRNIMVFIDQCPAHPNSWSKLRNICIEFLPP
jgi:hypothetical protein